MTGDAWYLGYKTPIVAPEPSVERVDGVLPKMGGRIGTHMILWVLSHDSEVRSWGQSLHVHGSESHGGAHRVAPQAASKMKAQAEAKFDMYCRVLH
jgi:hypothetical protein